MDRVAVFVDAGYLYAGGARSVSGVDGTRRPDTSLDIPLVLSYLKTKAKALSQVELLRIYWYDAAPSGRLTTDHLILASSDYVKLRLGVLNRFGEQKGVDGKIITDISGLSRIRVISDAVLLGGDEDLRIGVELAQEYGTVVHLLTIEGASGSATLRQESDTVTEVPRSDVLSFLTVKPATPTQLATPVPPASSQASPAPINPTSSVTPTIEVQVRLYLDALRDEERVSLKAALQTGTGVPSEHDGRLLAQTRAVLNRPLDAKEKIQVRKTLKAILGV